MSIKERAYKKIKQTELYVIKLFLISVFFLNN